MKSFRFRYLVIVALACIALLALWFCRHDSAAPYRTEIGSVWTTDYHITYASDRMLGDSVQVVLRRVDASASMYNDTSVVSRVNRNETNEVDSIFIRLYTTSRAVHASSGGAFDPTVQPLVEAWGFGHKTGTAPSQHTIDSLLAVVGIEKTELTGYRIVKRDRRVQLDFSSIAKGLACDEVGRMLSRNGVRNFLVEIGGEVLASGVNPQGQPWHVSVDLPVADSTASHHAPALVLALEVARAGQSPRVAPHRPAHRAGHREHAAERDRDCRRLHDSRRMGHRLHGDGRPARADRDGAPHRLGRDDHQHRPRRQLRGMVQRKVRPMCRPAIKPCCVAVDCQQIKTNERTPVSRRRGCGG